MKAEVINFKFCPVCAAELTPNREGYPACPQGHWAAWPDSVAGVGAIPIKDGKILIGRRGIAPQKGAYCPLGGFLAPGETLEEGALREAKEESGLDLRLTGLIGSYPDYYGWKPTINIFYRAEVIGGTQQAGDDMASLEWLPILELPDEVWESSLNNDQAVLRDLQDWWRKQSLPGNA